MLTQDTAEQFLKAHPLVAPRLATLARASELDPNIQHPHVMGGYLRNILMDRRPRDCDVVFEGYMRNQPGVLEAVREAEKQLGIEPYVGWEFENVRATGFSGNLYDDVLGEYTFHTDYLTMLMMDPSGHLFAGRPETWKHIEERFYEFYLPGIAMWATHRGNGWSYDTCIAGDLIRALHLRQDLEVRLSPHVEFLLRGFDDLFHHLSAEDRASRIAFWRRKTRGDTNIMDALQEYGITVLPVND